GDPLASSSLRAEATAALSLSSVTTAVSNVLDRMTKGAQSEDFKKIGDIASTAAGGIGLLVAAGLAAPILIEAGFVAGAVATTAKILTVVVPLADQLIHNVAGEKTSTAIDYTKLKTDIKELAVDLTIKAGLEELNEIKLPTENMKHLTEIVDKGIGLFDGLAG